MVQFVFVWAGRASEAIRNRLALCRFLPFLFVLCCLSYAGYAQASTLEFTEQELAWLNAHPVIRVGHSSKFEPILIKGPDGSFAGLLPDYYRLVGKRLGVSVEFVDDDWPEIHRRTIEKDIDVVAVMNKAAAQDLGLLTLKIPFNMSSSRLPTKSAHLPLLPIKTSPDCELPTILKFPVFDSKSCRRIQNEKK